MEQELGIAIQAFGWRLFYMVSGAVLLTVIVGLIGLWVSERDQSRQQHSIGKI